MCGRYTDNAELSDIRLAFEVEQLELFREWTPTYNVTPSYTPGVEQLVVVRTAEGKRTLRLGRFWLIPPGWRQPLKELPTTFNARAEELAKKPIWRQAFATRRCLVPATGWREFQGQRGKKQPYHFHFAHRLFAFAGLHSTWVTPEGEAVDTFAIVTTPPSPLAATIHDRMPLVLTPELYGAWLESNDAEVVLEQARAASLALPLEVYASDPIANSGRYEGPQAIAPLGAPLASGTPHAAHPAHPASTTPRIPSPPVQGELFPRAPASHPPATHPNAAHPPATHPNAAHPPATQPHTAHPRARRRT